MPFLKSVSKSNVHKIYLNKVITQFERIYKEDQKNFQTIKIQSVDLKLREIH
jgi:hypothetical protein